ncbi:DUF4377 domain-containing protein [Flavobacterium oreochromis]|uniref:DUF4377 domain-containing protein n=1 Tax=Flavobacterium oreochromis TaxID=2906078 RepID=UPI0013F67D28
MIRILLSTFTLILISCNTMKKDEKIIYIGPETKPCHAGMMETQCLQVKWTKNQKEWEHFYDSIKGFKFERGNEYELIIKKEKIKNAPADGANVKYSLVKEINKRRASN